MFWRKKKVVKRVKVQQIPLPVLIRQVIYDTMLMPAEGIAEAMGLPPISDEVAEMEEDASQERLERFAQLIPFIDSHADISARIATAAYMLEDEDLDDLEHFDIGDADNMTKLFRLVSLSSSMSCVSTLLNLGLIETKVTHGK